MSTANAILTVRGIEVEVHYKDIKNLHIGVYPPFGKVRVSAPTRLDTEQVRLAIVQRLPWIKRNQQQLRDAQRQTEREMVTGETHYVCGVRYRLKVFERPGRSHLSINGSRLELSVPTETEPSDRLQLLHRWQRQLLRERLTPMIFKWEERIGVNTTYWNIRKMKTKWGSCNPDSRRIWFNLELVQKDPRCIEYIVAHELTHLLERRHNDHFVALMDSFMPDWRQRRDELNSAPLAHADWDY